MRVSRFSKLLAVCAVAVTATSLTVIGTASAATSSNTVVTPTSPVYDSAADTNVLGVLGDSAPGFPTGSLASNGVGKTFIGLTPQQLFGRSVTLGDIASMSYWTKKATLHTGKYVGDWYVNIYTNPFKGDHNANAWYGERIGAEPYLSANMDETAGAWNMWSTDGATNRLRFFESTGGYFGSYTDPDWATFVARTGLAGEQYASQTVKLFTVQTGTAWMDGFTGRVDGLTITLTDGSVATVNFEASNMSTDKAACKSGGWASLESADGSAFKNQGDCIQYVNTGK